MGWFWGSSTSTDKAPEKVTQYAAPYSQAADTFEPENPPTPRTLTRDEQADVDLQCLLSEFQSSDSSSNPTPSGDSSTRTSRINTSSISPAALYPTSMSCRAAFDSAFYCQSLGGQWTNVYRYGGLRECGDMWRDFWFCMRTNRGSMNEERKIARVQEHYWKKDLKYRDGKSSEDVWEMRDQVLEGAFEGDLDAALREARKEEEERVV